MALIYGKEKDENIECVTHFIESWYSEEMKSPEYQYSEIVFLDCSVG